MRTSERQQAMRLQENETGKQTLSREKRENEFVNRFLSLSDQEIESLFAESILANMDLPSSIFGYIQAQCQFSQQLVHDTDATSIWRILIAGERFFGSVSFSMGFEGTSSPTVMGTKANRHDNRVETFLAKGFIPRNYDTPFRRILIQKGFSHGKIREVITFAVKAFFAAKNGILSLPQKITA